MVKYIRIIAALAALVFVFGIASNSYACANCKMHTAHAKPMEKHNETHGEVDADGKAKDATMSTVFSAEHLFTCPMHKEIITDNADAKCSLCNMKLSELSAEDVKSLRDSHPVGCPMDPVVANGKSDTEKCSMCKMKLMEIKKDEMNENKGHDHKGM